MCVQGLTSNRTGYNSSSSLYGGDITVADDDLDAYWTAGAAKKKGTNKKQKGTKNKMESNNNNGTNTNKKSKKSHTPIGFVNLGYGLVDESSSQVFSTTSVQGVCQILEKSYLRLTSAANPELVRPPKVLTLALTMVKRKWIETQESHIHTHNRAHR